MKTLQTFTSIIHKEKENPNHRLICGGHFVKKLRVNKEKKNRKRKTFHCGHLLNMTEKKEQHDCTTTSGEKPPVQDAVEAEEEVEEEEEEKG